MLDDWKERVQRAIARLPTAPERECCMCGARVGSFLPYRGGWRGAPPLLSTFDVVGSDLDNYLCPWCGCHDRERHLLLYLRHSTLLEKLRGSAVLHFAPESHLPSFIESAGPSRYVLADLFPSRTGIERIDLLAIPFAAATFDLVIANHVLEHVSDDRRALSEVRRVLKCGGHAVLQTPFSRLLESTFSDAGVSTPDARLQIYGQEDHVRLYGRDIFQRFSGAGFASRVREHAQVLAGFDPVRYGVNPKEPFFLFEAA